MAGLEDYPDDYTLIRNFIDTPESRGVENTNRVIQPYDEKSIVDLETEVKLKSFIGTSVGIVSLLAENLLSHPFVVLRRQCQVNNNSKKLHIVPLTFIPVICHLHQRQGLITLWKGLGSTLVVRGLTLGVEDVISKVTPWPKEVSWHSSLKSFFQHILLKSVSLMIIVPFYSASLVETVQSDIASEKPGILDVFHEGFVRILNWNGTVKGRMLPIWSLIVPAVALGITRYFISVVVMSGTSRLLQVRQKETQSRTGTLPKNIENLQQDIQLNASLISIITADVILYPFETILHRLYLQGTRTIIDNLDTGESVLPILTNYCGPIDCYETCLKNEGVCGLYKGFGALLLQYAAHILVIRITKFALTEITNILYKSHSKDPKVTTVSQNLPSQSYLIN